MTTGSPFDWLKAITETGENLFAQGRTDYIAPFINKGLSQYPDCMWSAFTMNTMYQLPVEIQNAYLLNTIQKKRRFSGPWPKPVEDDLIDGIQLVFNCGRPRALEISKLLDRDGKEKLLEHVKSRRPRKSATDQGISDRGGDADPDRDCL